MLISMSEMLTQPEMLAAFAEHLGNYSRRYPQTRYVSPYSLNRKGVGR